MSANLRRRLWKQHRSCVAVCVQSEKVPGDRKSARVVVTACTAEDINIRYCSFISTEPLALPTTFLVMAERACYLATVFQAGRVDLDSASVLAPLPAYIGLPQLKEIGCERGI
jgi:hypothetical protein